MKTYTATHTRRLWLALPIVLATLLWAAGCASWRSNPLDASWRGLGFDPNSVSKVIREDYQSFIKKQKNVSVLGADVTFFEDGKGQHAVSIEVWSKKKSVAWHYTLIYDKESKRIRTIKWGYGWYQS